ncbi:MAG: tyrosine-protein kinase Etk/Wzc [Maribacter sp.]|jgi:tyrosine-protein kinase Etk/Wzc
MEYSRDNLLDMVRTIFKWKKPIITTCLAIGIITAAISLLLPNYYEASTTFYAASPSLQSPNLGEKELQFYGTGEDMDRLVQASKSNELFNSMVQEFDLYQHYDIDTSDIKAKAKLRERFNKYFSVIKNERDAIILSIEDQDRELSAKMANAARDKINDIANGLIRGSQADIIKSYEKQISEKIKSLAIISDSLSILRDRYGIFDADYQKKVIGTQMPVLQSDIASEKARLEVYEKRSKRDSINAISTRIIGLEGKLKALNVGKNGLDISTGISLIGQLSKTEETIIEELGDDQATYEKYKSSFSIPKPALFVQDFAETPVIKSRPKRSFLVIGITFLTFLFSLLGVLVFEYNRDVDWKSIVNAK